MAGEKIIKPQSVTPETFKKFRKLIMIHHKDKPFEDGPMATAWLDVVEFDATPRTTILLTTKRRPMIVEKMERHLKTAEWWTMIDGRCVVTFAEGKRPGAADDEPDPAKISVFIMDGVAGYITNPGVWHWPAFPLAETTTQFVEVRVGTVEEDIHIKELPQPITIKL
jgi:ureidoglycolate hydrolase